MVVGNFCAPIQKYGGLGDWFLGTDMGGLTELDTSSCVTLRRFMEYSSLLLLTLLARGNMVHYFLSVLVSGSLLLGVWVLHVLVGTLDSSGDDSTSDTLFALVLAIRRISHNFYVDVDSVRYFSLFSRRMEEVFVLRPSSCCAARAWNLDIVSTSIRG